MFKGSIADRQVGKLQKRKTILNKGAPALLQEHFMAFDRKFFDELRTLSIAVVGQISKSVLSEPLQS